jgi:hypothetical protein
MSIRAVGPITAPAWALEIADPHRFASIADAVSHETSSTKLPKLPRLREKMTGSAPSIDLSEHTIIHDRQILDEHLLSAT